MANIKVNQQTSREPERAGSLARRDVSFPYFFRPDDFFSMDPFAMMRRITDEMDRAFGATGAVGGRMWRPVVEVKEREGNLQVCADLPGLNKDDVKVELTDEGLIIQGERKHEEKEEKEGFFRSERNYGQFYRLIPLPEGAEADKARAEFNNGVLEVNIPLAERKSNRREIPISAGHGAATTGQSTTTGKTETNR